MTKTPPQMDPQLGIFHLHLLQGSTLQGSADQGRGRGAGRAVTAMNWALGHQFQSCTEWNTPPLDTCALCVPHMELQY